MTTLWIDQTANEYDERSKELVELLASLIQTPAMARDALEDVPGLDLADVAWPEPFRARSFWTAFVVDLRRTSALKNLVQTMATRFPPKERDFISFLELTAARPKGWYAATNPLEAQFVGPGASHPMINRKKLREELALLLDQGYRTLNITGASASGKTFSLQLVQMLAERENFRILHVDVADWGTERFTAAGLIEAFAMQLRVPIDTTGVSNAQDPHTRARLLLYAFRDAFPVGRVPCWIVIDGLDRSNVDPDARAFVERLLKSIDMDAKPRNVRLIVTGFDGLLPVDSRRDPIGAITWDDVRELFRVSTMHLQHEVSDERLDGWTDEVMAGYDPAVSDLADLGAAVYRIVRDHCPGEAGGEE